MCRHGGSFWHSYRQVDFRRNPVSQDSGGSADSTRSANIRVERITSIVVAVRQGLRFLRAGLPQILATRTDVLSPRMVHVIEALAGDWRRLDERIEGLSADIETLVQHDPACQRLMTVPGIGPIISSAMVAAIGRGEVFSKGRDFGAWLGLVPKQTSTGDRTILGRISKRGNRYLRSSSVRAGGLGPL